MRTRRIATALRLLVLAGSLVAAAVLLDSCSAARAYIAVARGNQAYDRGSYQQATVDYLRAAQGGAYSHWVAYDLGNVYHALGEPDGASAEWKKAEKANDLRVIVPTLFNEGILDYELGRYREAYDRFRKVLELTPSDVAAKVDLELAFSKMTTKEVPPRSGTQTEPIAVKHNQNQAKQILEIIRQKESGYFTPPPPSKQNPKVANW